MKKVDILNIQINSISKIDLLKTLIEGVVFTPNVDHIVKLQHDKEFYKAYSGANFIVCDSRILAKASNFLGDEIKEVIPGSDLLPAFYNYHKDNIDMNIFLLGAAEGVALKARKKINRKVGRNIIIGAHSPSFGFENNTLECENIVKLINRSKANVLVVGVGAPKQEKWIMKYKDQLVNIKIFMGLGATIDFEAGHVRRAPKFFQYLHLEWLYRFLLEPSRLFRRYFIEDFVFFKLILKQKLNIYRDPMQFPNNSI